MTEKPPYRLKSRKLACENSQFKVFYDHVEGKNGFEIQDYITVVPKRRHPGDITGVAILPVVEEKIALLKIYRHIVEDWSWKYQGVLLNPAKIKYSRQPESWKKKPAYCAKRTLCIL